MVWDIDPILFRIPFLNLAVRYYGVIFALNFILGLLLFRWQIKRSGAPAEEALDMVWPGFLGLLIGARLGHVFFYNFNLFLKDPLWLFKVWEGGLTSHGAAIGLLAAVFWYARRHRRPFWDVCDRLCFSGALGAALIRLGNFFNSEIVGRVTDAAWAVKFPRYDFPLPADLAPFRYPSQLVEFGAGMLILGILLLTDRLAGGEKRPRGLISSAFFTLYFLARFLIEFIKERQGPQDDLLLSRGQILSVPPLILGLILLAVIICHRPRHCG
ncbi:MAG: prolipoprotein diacylglyceryl transferase [Deltaproteobacteria bacterium]|nr:prolipoprotein diacylglyceryl transferase [Deltaproteobacteria bacterium]